MSLPVHIVSKILSLCYCFSAQSCAGAVPYKLSKVWAEPLWACPQLYWEIPSWEGVAESWSSCVRLSPASELIKWGFLKVPRSAAEWVANFLTHLFDSFVVLTKYSLSQDTLPGFTSKLYHFFMADRNAQSNLFLFCVGYHLWNAVQFLVQKECGNVE